MAKKKSTAVALAEPVSGAVVIGGRKFEIKKRVTVPVLKQVEGQAVVFEVLSRMYTGERLKNDKDPNRQPPTMVNVRELTTGREMKYIVPAVLKREWSEQYDGDADNKSAKHTYVGVKFSVYLGPMADTKDGKRRVRQLECVEIEDNGEVA